MSQPILSIQSDDPAGKKSVANLLPCRIHHNGSIDTTRTFWNPSTADDGTRTAYFRGRKLHGKKVDLPQQYRGMILEKKDETETLDIKKQQESSEEDHDHLETGAMQVEAEFDEMIVWGHESTADESTDPYLRSMGEWLQVAGQIHSYSTEDKGDK